MYILLVEDDLDLGAALLAALKTEGISAQWVRRANDARAALGPEVGHGAAGPRVAWP